MLFPKIRYGVVIRMLVRRQIAERHILIGLPLDGSRTSHAHAIAVQQQARQQKRMVSRLPPAIRTIVGRIDGRQVQLLRYVGEEPRQVPFGKPLLQRGSQEKRLIQRAGSELEAHARILTKPRRKGNSSTKKSRYPTKFRRFLSDRLLGHSQNLIDLYAAQLRYDETYRREWCKKAGLGFELGELGYKSEAPIRPALVA